jgi:FAD binding domain
MSKENGVSRREFMKKTVVAGATVTAAGAIGSISPTPVMAAGIPRKWDKEVDVVVVGTGFVGLAAGITAKEAGAKVVIIEKARKEHEGGNSKVSGNMWWTPTNEQDGFTYVKALAMGTTDDESLRALEAEHVKLNDWLSSKFGIKPAAIGGLFEPEHPELPGHECVRTWGNLGKWGNGEIYDPIREYADKIKIEFMYETPAKDLFSLLKEKSSVSRRKQLGNRSSSKPERVSFWALAGLNSISIWRSNSCPGGLSMAAARHTTPATVSRCAKKPAPNSGT